MGDGTTSFPRLICFSKSLIQMEQGSLGADLEILVAQPLCVSLSGKWLASVPLSRSSILQVEKVSWRSECREKVYREREK